MAGGMDSLFAFAFAFAFVLLLVRLRLRPAGLSPGGRGTGLRWGRLLRGRSWGGWGEGSGLGVVRGQTGHHGLGDAAGFVLGVGAEGEGGGLLQNAEGFLVGHVDVGIVEVRALAEEIDALPPGLGLVWGGGPLRHDPTQGIGAVRGEEA